MSIWSALSLFSITTLKPGTQWYELQNKFAVKLRVSENKRAPYVAFYLFRHFFILTNDLLHHVATLIWLLKIDFLKIDIGYMERDSKNVNEGSRVQLVQLIFHQ